MKLRLSEEGIRFRIDDEDLKQLRSEHCLNSSISLPTVSGSYADFTISVKVGADGSQIQFAASPFGMHLVLAPEHLTALEDVTTNGISLNLERQETRDGSEICVIVIEKDKMRRNQKKKTLSEITTANLLKVDTGL